MDSRLSPDGSRERSPHPVHGRAPSRRSAQRRPRSVPRAREPGRWIGNEIVEEVLAGRRLAEPDSHQEYEGEALDASDQVTSRSDVWSAHCASSTSMSRGRRARSTGTSRDREASPRPPRLVVSALRRSEHPLDDGAGAREELAALIIGRCHQHGSEELPGDTEGEVVLESDPRAPTTRSQRPPPAMRSADSTCRYLRGPRSEERHRHLGAPRREDRR